MFNALSTLLGHIEAVVPNQNKCCLTGIIGELQYEYPTQSQYTHTRPTRNLVIKWIKSFHAIASAAGRNGTRDSSIPRPSFLRSAMRSCDLQSIMFCPDFFSTNGLTICEFRENKWFSKFNPLTGSTSHWKSNRTHTLTKLEVKAGSSLS